MTNNRLLFSTVFSLNHPSNNGSLKGRTNYVHDKDKLGKKMLQIREKPDSSARIWWSFQIKVSNEENNFGRKLSRSTNPSAEKENCIDCRVLPTTIATIAMIIIFVYVGGGLGAGVMNVGPWWKVKGQLTAFPPWPSIPPSRPCLAMCCAPEILLSCLDFFLQHKVINRLHLATNRKPVHSIARPIGRQNEQVLQWRITRECKEDAFLRDKRHWWLNLKTPAPYLSSRNVVTTIPIYELE